VLLRTLCSSAILHFKLWNMELSRIVPRTLIFGSNTCVEEPNACVDGTIRVYVT
jgi:hypothetical protein